MNQGTNRGDSGMKNPPTVSLGKHFVEVVDQTSVENQQKM